MGAVSGMMVTMTTRRQFLASSLPLALYSQTPRRVDRSRISALTDEIARTPQGAIEFLKQYGLHLAELREVPGGGGAYDEALSDEQLRAAARELNDAGMRVSFLDAGSMKYMLPGTQPVRVRQETDEARAKRLARDGQEYERRMEHMRKALNAAKILGADKVRVFAFGRVAEPLKLMPRIAEVLQPMVDLAAAQKIQLLVENEGSCNVATAAELAALMKLMPSKYIGVNWDITNGMGQKEVPFPDGYNLLPKDRIGNVHIKGRSVLDYPERQDWRAIFDTMTKDGYTGNFGLETHIFGAGQIQASHDSMKAILRILEG
ncbi:MAG: sugar phosphate isomerase/epimerase [Acidobacteriales bacterium]|nr:MAG: sugar phosphate isomerase/epimerase [Terriglobales bacterium]